MLGDVLINQQLSPLHSGVVGGVELGQHDLFECELVQFEPKHALRPVCANYVEGLAGEESRRVRLVELILRQGKPNILRFLAETVR